MSKKKNKKIDIDLEFNIRYFEDICVGLELRHKDETGSFLGDDHVKICHSRYYTYPTLFFKLLDFAKQVKNGVNLSKEIFEDDLGNDVLFFGFDDTDPRYGNVFSVYHFHIIHDYYDNKKRKNVFRFLEVVSSREEVVAWVQDFLERFVNHPGFLWQYLYPDHAYNWGADTQSEEYIAFEKLCDKRLKKLTEEENETPEVYCPIIIDCKNEVFVMTNEEKKGLEEYKKMVRDLDVSKKRLREIYEENFKD